MTITFAKRQTLVLAASALALTIGATAPAYAQDATAAADDQPAQGNDIIVTASKRSTTVQDVPFSINAQTAQDIARSGANTLEDVSRSVAGLTIQNLGPGQSQVSIRGVSAGQVVRDQPGVKEQVGIYLDESVISLSLFTPDLDLFDLNRVETLRGPQGTLFGSGSVGGTIRYITNQPKLGKIEGAIEANVNVLEGGDVGYGGKGVINLPLGETAAIRAVGYGQHYGGFIDAIGPAGGKNVNDGERYGGRVSLLWQPIAGISITPRVVYQKIDVNGFNREDVYNFYDSPLVAGNTPIPERTQYLKLRERFRDEMVLADLTASVDITDHVQLTSVTSYTHRDILVSRDASALTGSVYVSFSGATAAAGGGAALNSNLLDTTKLEQWTQEIRLSSTGSGPFQWVIGGFYSNTDRTYAQRLPTPGSDVFGQLFLDVVAPGTPISALRNGFPADSPYNADIPYNIEQYAGFGEASYKLGQFKLTAGGRYYNFRETRDFISGGIFSNDDTRRGDKTRSDGFTPRFIATFEPDRNLSINLQASKGFRLGGVNDPLNIPLCSGGATGVDAQTFGNRPTYKDETLWNYEAGLKASHHGITFNAAVFYNDISNLQVTADAGSCSSRVVFNVPKAHSTGAEIELNIRPGGGFDLGFSGTLIDSKFDSTVTTADGATVIAGIRAGNRLPTVPQYTLAANASYTTKIASDLDWELNSTVQHIGDRFTQPGDQEPGTGAFSNSLYFDPATGTFGSGSYNFGSYRLPDYTIVNLSTGVTWQNGLSIKAYINNLLDETPLLSLDRERGGRARLGYSVGQPRTYGVTVRKTF